MQCEVTVYGEDLAPLGDALTDLQARGGRPYLPVPVSVRITEPGVFARVRFRLVELEVTFYPGAESLVGARLRSGQLVSFHSDQPIFTIVPAALESSYGP